jgi:phosphomannomutase
MSGEAPLMLTVSGMRGLVGRSLTPEVVARYAVAFGNWLTERCGEAPVVVLGRDSRPSGELFESAAAAGLAAAGCRVVRLGIVSTPGVAIMVEHLRAAGGMVVTASHNPIAWSGIKPLRHDGTAPPAEQAQSIIDAFRDGPLSYARVEKLHPIAARSDAATVHVEKVLGHIDADVIRAARLKVVIDSVHGAGGAEAALLLDELKVQRVHLYPEPTGLFPHNPEPLRENLTELASQVRAHSADIGFAQDPDADRLAVVDEAGTYIGEEYTLALCAYHLMRAGDVAVANLSTSRMIDDVAARAGGRIVRSPVGEANVAQAMRDHRASIGGEGNGGVIWPRVTYVRDSLVGMALLLQMLAARKRKLSEVVAELPRYAIVKDKAPLEPRLVAGLADTMKAHFAGQKLDTQDGVRVDLDDRWVHVRPSNTEPIVRIIAEARDESAARVLVAEARSALGIS